MKFRDLTADEIEVRIATVSEKDVSLLLYKNARCDMNILDETVGAENWQRDHKELKGNIYCGIGIWDEKKSQWIWKWDCGAESYTEKEKGEASDSFKRAGFNIGIGRELYTAPFIWITDCKIEKNSKGKLVCYDRFKVSKIEIKDKKITKLEIKCKNKVVFSMGYNFVTKAPEIEKTAHAVICPKCGIQISNTPVRSGKVLSPDEVMEKWGMCARCYKEEIKIKKTLEDLKRERP